MRPLQGMPKHRRRVREWQWWAAAAAGALLAHLAAWLLTVDDVRVWPVRNTLEYRLATAWWSAVGRPQYGTPGAVTGVVRDRDGRPVAGARVLLSAWDGTAFSARASDDGGYAIERVPSGRYAAAAAAPGYVDASIRAVRVPANGARRLDVALRPLLSPTDVRYGGVTVVGHSTVSSSSPIEASAVRLRLFYAGPARFERPTDGAPVYLYLPPGTQEASHAVPLLLTAYPGPAEEWESVSAPLAAAGYGVLAYGPPYGFDPERAVFALAGLVDQAAGGRMPGVDGTRIAVLGGSYSGLHVLRLLQQDDIRPLVDAAVLMGAPTDLFDMRRRLEDRTFVPPFGLDQGLVALGFPDRETLRYWRYSGAYHVRSDMPPVLLIHSRSDAVVPHEQSELLARTLSQVGVPHDLHLLDGGSHYLLSEERDAQSIYALTLRFLGERLG